MRNRIPLAISAIATLTAVACFDRVAGGAGAGNPPLAEVALSLDAKAVVPPAKRSAEGRAGDVGPFTVRDMEGMPITLTGIELRIEKIGFSRPDSATCVEGKAACLDREFGLKGDFTMDLLTGKSMPEIGILRIPPGKYERIGLSPRVSDSLPGSDRPRFNLLLKGVAGPPGSERDFAMEIDLDEGFDFVSPDGIRIAPDSLNRLRLSLAVDGWFRGTDLDPCLESVLTDSTGYARIRGLGACAGPVERVGSNLHESEQFEEEREGER